MKELYKKDSKGKIRVWRIHTNGGELIQESGLLHGALVTNSKICKVKNKGKSNETTPEQQAILEMESKILDKSTEGYFDDLIKLEGANVILPMLAKEYGKEANKVAWNQTVFIQPKLDGMRCMAYIENGAVVLKSRDGKIIQNMEHIIGDLKRLIPGIVLDGELYCHGLSFQENMKLIKKYRPDETENIKYHIYDVVDVASFEDRFYMRNLDKLFTEKEERPNLIKVHTKILLERDNIKLFHLENMANLYEGSIIRWGKDSYKMNSRSSNLLKYKDFQDIDAEIIDITPAEQRPEWGVPVLRYRGNEFRAGMKYSHDDRKEFLINKDSYIGKMANIRFFEWTDDGVPRFPVMIGIHGDR